VAQLNVPLVATVAAYMMTNASGFLLIASARHAGSPTGVLRNPGLLIGVFLYGISFLIWVVALQKFPATTVYPLFIGGGYTATTIASVAFLGESISPLKGVGMAVVGLGVVMVVQ
jgi:multidrug transporter EmrE-like cation transporter